MFSFVNNRGQKQFAQSWQSKSNSPVAVLIIVHGFGDYTGRYSEMAVELASKGNLIVYAYDQIAHGRSEGEADQYFSRFSFLPEDLHMFVTIVQEKTAKNNIPYFIYGHSMGGLVTVSYLQDENVQKIFCGAILHSPPLAKPEQVTPPLQLAANVVGVVAPHQGIERLAITTLTRDPIEMKKYEEDPLIWHAPVKAKTAVELVDATEMCQKHWAAAISLSILHIQGTADQMVPAEAAEPWFIKTSSQDKTFCKILNGFHEGHHDSERYQIFQLIQNWIQGRIQNSDRKECNVMEFDALKST